MSSNDVATPLKRIEFFLNTLNHVLIGFVTIYLSWMCIRLDLAKTALHAWLCVFGYHFLMAEAVMSHYQGNVLMFTYSRKAKTTIHWVLQALGGGLGIAGTVVKILDKEVHFTTLHGKLGLASLILCGLSMITGLSALYAQSLHKVFKPLFNKTFHNLLGLAAFVVSMVALYYGYDTGFFRRKVTPDQLDMFKVFTALVIVLSSYGPLKALCEKVLSMTSD